MQFFEDGYKVGLDPSCRGVTESSAVTVLINILPGLAGRRDRFSVAAADTPSFAPPREALATKGEIMSDAANNIPLGKKENSTSLKLLGRYVSGRLRDLCDRDKRENELLLRPE